MQNHKRIAPAKSTIVIDKAPTQCELIERMIGRMKTQNEPIDASGIAVIYQEQMDGVNPMHDITTIS